MENNELILIDYNWVYIRSVFAFSQLEVRVGDEIYPTGGCFGILNMISTLIESYKNVQIILCLDDYPKDRMDAFPDYKSGRTPNEQVVRAKKLNNDLLYVCSQLPQVKITQGKFKEADDLMSQLGFMFKDKCHVTIFSGDKDLMQMCSIDNVDVSSEFNNKKLVNMTEKYIHSKFEIGPKYLPYFRGLNGDSSDSIPGVVPRVKKDLLRKFAVLLHDNNNDYDIALDKFLTDNKVTSNAADKFKNAKEGYLRNYNLMNLLKYAEDENRFKIEIKRFASTKSVTQILDELKLVKFKEFYIKHYG